MSSVNYPLWYGLPRGVELRDDGKPAAVRRSGEGFTLPWEIQIIGLVLPMLAGAGLIAFHFETSARHPLAEERWTRFLASDAGTAYLASGAVNYLLPVGIALLAAGLALALRTRFLRRLSESDPITKALAIIYLAPGVLLTLLAGGVIALIAGVMLLYLALFLIIGLLWVVGAFASSGS